MLQSEYFPLASEEGVGMCRLRWSVGLSLVAAWSVSFAGCNTRSPLPVGETFESVTGDQRIVVQSESVVDVLEDDVIYNGAYKVQDDGQIRVSVAVLGTEVVQYYRHDEANGRLEQLSSSGEVVGSLFDRAHIEAAREGHYCALLMRDLLDLVDAQNEHFSKRRTYAVDLQSAQRISRPDRGNEWRISGVSSQYFVALARNANCGKVYLQATEPGLIEATQDVAEEEWERLLEKVASDTRLEEERQRKAAEELARQTSESKQRSRTVGQFSAYDYTESFEYLMKVTISDVGLEVEYGPGKPTQSGTYKRSGESWWLWFGNVRSLNSDDCSVVWRGLWKVHCIFVRTVRGTNMPNLVFEDPNERDAAFKMVSDAWELWKNRYPDAYHAHGGRTGR